MPDRGILYVAIGESYLQDANQAAARASRVTDLPISIVAHREVENEIYDEVIVDENPQYSVGDKSKNLLKTPYDETLYLDVDTYLIDDVVELFGWLERAPLAVTLDPHEGSLHSGDYDIDDDIPMSFPEYQTGVIVYRQSPIVNEFISDWVESHRGSSYPDQLSFRETLYKGKIEIGIFPGRYNTLMASIANGPVKILHDNNRNLRDLSEENLDSVLSQMNNHLGVRVPYSSYSLRLPTKFLSQLIPFQINLLLMRHGYQGLLRGLVHLMPNR